MSGGSYNYLHRYRVAEERRDDLEEMALRLNQLAPGSWAALQTGYVLALIDDANARIKQLDPAWQAVEWHDSGDWSAEQVTEVVDRKEPKDLRPPVA